MNIGLHGVPRCGKNAYAEALRDDHGFVIVSIADHIRRRAVEVNYIYNVYDEAAGDAPGQRYSELVERLGYEGLKDHPVYGGETRAYLQSLALHERQTRGETVYVDVAAETVARLRAADPYVSVAVPDIRYPSDAAWLRGEIGLTQIWRIERIVGGVALRDASGHIAERPLPPEAIDTVMLNDRHGLEHVARAVGVQIRALGNDIAAIGERAAARPETTRMPVALPGDERLREALRSHPGLLCQLSESEM